MKVQFARSLVCAGTIGFIFSFGSLQANAEDLDAKLRRFGENPKAFINDIKNLQKYDPDTEEPILNSTVFPDDLIRSKDFIFVKDEIQKSAKSYRIDGRAPYQSNDRPQDLVDALRYQTLEEMEQANLKSNALEISPWSDDYWPIYTGVIALRYGDPNFPYSENWNINKDYILNNSCSVDNASPAEKYDMLVGDREFTLTKKMLEEGRRYGGGNVQKWMGICHGWAPASFMLARPTHTIHLTAPDGTKIPFYPSDIKGLASLLWANAKVPNRFIGGRCDQKNPPEDANGRILAQNCFDTNPGTWHLSVVNQLAGKRTFVMDATYDYEVWNQPILSYKYRYFNPMTLKSVHTLEEATVSRQSFVRGDKFSRYRSSRAHSIVGISMKVVYIKETQPSKTSPDHASRDKRIAVDYLYDLELDANGVIIGGEWYNRAHPDFLWVPAENARALTAFDRALLRAHNGSGWNGTSILPEDWMNAAKNASSRSMPLAHIVEALVHLSNL